MDTVIDIMASRKDSRELIMPHQQEAVDALNVYFDLTHQHKGAQKGLLVMPTGSGKTFTAVTWLLESGIVNGYRILWFAHRQELIDQTWHEFYRSAPLLKMYGIEKLRILPISAMHYGMSAAMGYDINICSIQSAASRNGSRYIERMIGKKGADKLIVVIDEAHHAMMPSYQKVLKRILQINPDMVLLGLTATPSRMSSFERKKLFEMFNVPQNKVQHKGSETGYIYEVKLKNLIKYGFLSQPIYRRQNTEIRGDREYSFTPQDVAFFNRFGELSEGLMNEIASSAARNKLIVNHYLEHQAEYGKTLVFAINQGHARYLCDEFKENGISCDYVVSGKEGTHQTIQDFRDNKFQILINVQIMTEGSDVPDIHTVFLTRETNSDVLLMQMIGRGLRGAQAGGTTDAYIVDFHDTWDKINFWMDPHSLDVFADEEEQQLKEKKKGMEEKPGDLSENETDEDDTDWDAVYALISQVVRTNLVAQTAMARWPVGWYKVLREDGLDDAILVYNDQLEAYAELDKRQQDILSKPYTVHQIMEALFDTAETMPIQEDFNSILEMLRENQEMPEYYTFAKRDQVSPTAILQRMWEHFGDSSVIEDKQEYWLKAMYEKSGVLRALYKTFYMFKKSVELAMKTPETAKVLTIDEREVYHVVPEYYDLHELLQEIKQQYPKLAVARVLSVTWSKKVLSSWFGICKRIGNDPDTAIYKIRINKLLSSPDVNREAVKYVMFHELLHASGLWKHDENFRCEEWQYPDSEKWDGFLDSLDLQYKLDIPALKREFNEQEPRELVEDSQAENPTFKPAAPGVKTGFKYCRNCGNRMPDTAKFCNKCGQNVMYS